MPKLPPAELDACPGPRFVNVLCAPFAKVGRLGDFLSVSSNDWFVGGVMTESDEIKDEITSGDAGCTRTRFAGPGGGSRRELYIARLGIGGGVVNPSMLTLDN